MDFISRYMARISPFRAIHYDIQSIENLSHVITPPYDNIPEGEDKKYLARSPYNFAHIILPQSINEDYSRSQSLLHKWRSRGILTVDNQPGYYLYRQAFTLDGTDHCRDSLMCTVELTDFGQGIVRPHENTYGQFKSDRLQILRQTRCNLSHVFGMVKDPEGYLNSLYEKWEFQPPLLKGETDDGVSHTVWKLELGRFPDLAGFFEDKPIYIVDGHHRYESALAYARETGAVGKPDHPGASMLFSIANAYDPALVVFPTHRMIRGVETIQTGLLEKRYSLLPMTPDDLMKFVAKPRRAPEFALYWPERGEDKLFLCCPKHWETQEENLGHSLYKLAVHWSDRFFLPEVCGVDDTNRKEKVAYEKDARKLWDNRRDARMIIFHAPPAITDIMDVADEKKFMPQKSTYFFPKLAAGLIMRDLALEG